MTLRVKLDDDAHCGQSRDKIGNERALGRPEALRAREWVMVSEELATSAMLRSTVLSVIQRAHGRFIVVAVSVVGQSLGALTAGNGRRVVILGICGEHQRAHLRVAASGRKSSGKGAKFRVVWDDVAVENTAAPRNLLLIVGSRRPSS